MGKWLLNNWFTRKGSYLIYNAKRIKLMRNLSLQKKLFWCFVLIVSTPLLLTSMLQYIYMTNYLPFKEIRSIYSTVEQYEKKLQYEFGAIKQKINMLTFNNEINDMLTLPPNISESDTARKIITIRDQMADYNFTDEANTFLRVYVNWNTDLKYLFNDKRITLIDSFLENPIYRHVDLTNGKIEWIGNHEGALGERSVSAVKTVINIKNRALLGVLEIEFKTQDIENVFNDMLYEDIGTILLVDESANIIACNDSKMIESYPPNKIINVISKMSEEQKNTAKISNELVTLKKNDITDWTLISFTPVSYAYRDVRILSDFMMLVLVLFLLLAAGFSFPLAYNISDPIKKLTKATRKIEKGDLSVVLEVDGNDEISELCQSFNQMTHKIHNLIETVYKTEIERKNAELSLLQSQINPHFLYNTLDTINWIALADGNHQVAKMSRSLADFFRFSLSAGQTVISVEDEIKMVKNYLNIQKIRLDGRLNVVYNISDEAERKDTLKLILQPLVENSILHGFGEDTETLQITISAQIEDSTLIFRVEDNGAGSNISKIEEILISENGNHHGISNVNKRIKMFYGEDCGLKYSASIPHGICVEIRIKL